MGSHSTAHSRRAVLLWWVQVYLHNAMAAVVQLLKTKIVASAKDLVGVWFYGSVRSCCVNVAAGVCGWLTLFPPQASKKNSNSFDHVYEFIELASPSATAIKQAEVR